MAKKTVTKTAGTAAAETVAEKKPRKTAAPKAAESTAKPASRAKAKATSAKTKPTATAKVKAAAKKTAAPKKPASEKKATAPKAKKSTAEPKTKKAPTAQKKTGVKKPAAAKKVAPKAADPASESSAFPEKDAAQTGIPAPKVNSSGKVKARASEKTIFQVPDRDRRQPWKGRVPFKQGPPPDVAPPPPGIAPPPPARAAEEVEVTPAPRPKPAPSLPPPDVAPELPKEYGDTVVVAMLRDPQWLFVYWEINDLTRSRLGLVRGRHNRALMLRLCDITGRKPSAKPHSTVDVPVNDLATSWYVAIPAAGRTYTVELGFVTDAGDFVLIAASAPVDVPEPAISTTQDKKSSATTDEVFEQIVRLSGGPQVHLNPASDQFLRVLQQRIFKPGPEAGAHSGGIAIATPFGIGGASDTNIRRIGVKDRGFWLEVGVDVIVYGRTEPDAKVKLMGREIQLTPDGRFRIRMTLPDGTIEFPVEATSADGVETRSVTPIVTRVTQ